MTRGFCGIGIFHTKTPANVGTLWRSAHGFGADFLFTVGRRYQREASDTTKAWKHVPLYHYLDMADLKAHLPFECRLVGIEYDEDARPLPSYVHPERACYILGAEDGGLSPEAVRACHDLIVVPGAARCLNVATAGSIVLYDRITRGHA